MEAALRDLAAPPPVAPDVSVVVPCLNEEETVAGCVRRARAAAGAAGLRGEVVVVDNGSTDRSAARAADCGARIVFEPVRGYGRAYLRGLAEARGRLILMGDGDGTYDFRDLPRFAEAMERGADLVMGSRLRGRVLPGAMPWTHRWIGVPALTWLLNVVGRLRVSDAHCGMRMIRRSALERLELRAPGMEFASEMLLEAGRAGLSVTEVPIEYAPRAGGRPKLRSIPDGLRHLRCIFGYARPGVLAAPAAALAAAGVGLLAWPSAPAAAIVAGGVLVSPTGLLLARGGLARRGVLEAARRRFLALAGGHRPFTVALAVAVLLRLVAILAYRPALFFYGDSYSYLQMADDLSLNPARPNVYPLLLRTLFLDDAVGAIPVVQHVMGLATGTMLYALLRRLGAGTFAGIVGAAPMLFDAYQLNIEHSVLTEALFQLLVVGAVLLVAWRARPSPRACAGAGVLLAAATLTRTVGLLLVLPFLAYVLGRRLGARRVGALAIGFFLPVLGYASAFRVAHGAFALDNVNGLFLYGRVAPFVDCARTPVASYEKVLCERRPPEDRPGTNFYVWNRRSPARRFRPPPGDDRNEALRHFAWRAILNQPVEYGRAVAGDFAHYFAPGRSTGTRDQGVETWQFQRTPQQVHRATAAGRAVPPPGRSITVVRPFADVLIGYQRGVYSWGPALALALVLGLLGAGGLPKALPDGRRLGAECFLLTSGGLLLLVVPSLTVMFDYRYLLSALPLLGPGGALGGYVLAEWFRLPVPGAQSRVPAPEAHRATPARAPFPAAPRGVPIAGDGPGLARGAEPAGLRPAPRPPRGGGTRPRAAAGSGRTAGAGRSRRTASAGPARTRRAATRRPRRDA